MRIFLFIAILFISIASHAQVISLRDQARVTDEILADRLNNLLPGLMEKNGIDNIDEVGRVISNFYDNKDDLLKGIDKGKGSKELVE